MKKSNLFQLFTGFLIFSAILFSSCGAKDLKEQDLKMEKSKSISTEQPTSKGNTSQEELIDETGTSNASTEKSSNQSKDALVTDATVPVKTTAEKVTTKLIKTADISMQVKNYKESRKTILALVKTEGAYISSENQSNGTYSIVNDMEIRIKPESFEAMIDKIAEQGILIDYKKITADDVTDEYVDAAARLKSKKEVEVRYSEILKKANTIYDILAVEEKLRQIREEIESYQGKIKLMDDQVSYSTIKVHFYEKLDYTPAAESGFGYKIGKAFKSGWNGFLMFIVGFIYAWPVWLIAGAITWLVLWIIKRGKKKSLK